MQALIAAGADPFQGSDDFDTPLGRVDRYYAQIVEQSG